MGFFSVVPNEFILRYNHVFPLDLKVIQSNSIEVTPDSNITVTDLNDGYKHFLNKGYGGITFKIEVIIKKDDIWNAYLWNNTKNKWDAKNPKVTEILEQWIASMTSLYVVTDAIDIPNGKYVITKNSSRKQTYKDSTVWSLEFTTYNSLTIYKFKENSYVKTAKKNYKKAKAQAKKKAAQAKKAKANNTTKNKLKKCKLSSLKYSKKKKVVKCVTYMQTILYKKGFLKKKQVDGWFGSITTGAVKKFQKKYKKKYKLKVTGKVDKATLKALISV